VSNLPTVWTNVLVGLALGGWSGDRPWLAVLALAAGSLLYTGGMLLNDVMDASWDRAHKRDRPIAEGRLSDRLAGSLAMGCLFGGVGLAASRGDQAAGFAGALVAAIVLYNWLHKRSPLAVVFMAGCRALLYPLAAIMISGEPVHAVWPVSAAVGVYTVLLTLAARREDRAGATVSRAIAWLVPAPFFVAASAYPADRLLWTVLTGAALLAWSALAARRAVRGEIRPAVLGWLSGFCLADAFVLMLVGEPGLAALAVLGWVVTVVGHRSISGT